MSNNKQSSIEWLFDELTKYFHIESEYKNTDDILIKAKAMHEIQVRRAFYDGQRYEGTKSSMEYYNETFGGNNEQ